MSARLVLAAAAAAPLAVAGLLRWRPRLDVPWESHPAHFWLVLLASILAVALATTIFGHARRRRDARLVLVSLAFVASSGFLGLHALATPGVLLGKNAGFELATPAGLVLGAAFVALSSLELAGRGAVRVVRAAPVLLGGLLALIVLWGAVSLAELPPLDDPLQGEELNGWQNALGAPGVLLYALAALGYARLYRRRRGRFLLAVTVALALLADALVVIAVAESWRVSWWEWHVLMLGGFLVIAAAARLEWHEERFSALYLDRTLAGATEASVLFADLEGYTAFAERTPPAQVAAMLNAYFDRLVPLLQDAGAEVHQLVGDSIMAVFNKAGDQPEHALLAARAALALQQEAAAVARERPGWPRFRVGVASGEVLAGVLGAERGHRKHGLVGDTVNLAARLEAQAPVGRVVVARGTADRIPGEAALERLPELRVKGKREPVEAFVLHGLAV